MFSAWGFGLNTNGWTDPYNINYEYGQFLGNRYKDEKNVIFSAAGELISIMDSYTALTDSTRVEWLRRLEQGIDSSCNSKQLITIHGNSANPGKKMMPSDFFKSDFWLDFYGNQCWHRPEYIDNQINGDYMLTNLVKPTINMEPGYEDVFSAASAAHVARPEHRWVSDLWHIGPYSWAHLAIRMDMIDLPACLVQVTLHGMIEIKEYWTRLH